ncbi:MAG: GNAT family N-acetyltransferase [Coprothermobacterota bacterium]|nr:GNAT family N-acetyltransferase [Coprothermobacterota bacterium]
MKLEIRPYQQGDADGVAAVANVNWPDHPISTEELLFQDAHQDPKCFFGRWVVEREGRVIAFADLCQMVEMYHPHKYVYDVQVLPSCQRQGIGSSLHELLLGILGKREALSARSWTHSTHTQALDFLQHRGFVEDMRSWDSTLEVKDFDFTPYQGVTEKLEAEGFHIRTFRQLKEDPQRNRKIYDLVSEFVEDIPFPEQATSFSPEYFESWFQDPALLPDGYLLMVQGERYVGLSDLWTVSGQPDRLRQGLTGVRRDCRHKGIALALKLTGIRFCQAYGASRITTSNEIHNQPMLALNERLGFTKQAAWLSMNKVLREENSIDLEKNEKQEKG